MRRKYSNSCCQCFQGNSPQSAWVVCLSLLSFLHILVSDLSKNKSSPSASEHHGPLHAAFECLNRAVSFSRDCVLTAKYYIDIRKWAFCYWKHVLPSAAFLRKYGSKGHCLWSTYLLIRTFVPWCPKAKGSFESTQDRCPPHLTLGLIRLLVKSVGRESSPLQQEPLPETALLIWKCDKISDRLGVIDLNERQLSAVS